MHVEPGVLAGALERVSAARSDEQDLATTMLRIVDALRSVYDVTGAGLLLADEDDVLRYAAATDTPGQVLERLHEETGEGPCIDAYLDDRLVETVDLTQEQRWPRLAPRMVGEGVGAVLGVPVHLGGSPVGSLNVYCDHAHEWDDSEQAAIAAFADILEARLDTAVVAREHGRTVEQLQYALDNRVVIERAVGLIMGQEGVDARPAFERLRAAARAQRRRVGELAAELLESRSLDALD